MTDHRASSFEESFEDLSSPFNILLTADITLTSLETAFTLLHDTYDRLDQAIQDAAAAGLQYSPRRGERLSRRDTDSTLRNFRERNANAAFLCGRIEDAKPRADRVERRIREIEKAIEVKKENDRMDQVEFESSLQK